MLIIRKLISSQATNFIESTVIEINPCSYFHVLIADYISTYHYFITYSVTSLVNSHIRVIITWSHAQDFGKYDDVKITQLNVRLVY